MVIRLRRGSDWWVLAAALSLTGCLRAGPVLLVADASPENDAMDFDAPDVRTEDCTVTSVSDVNTWVLGDADTNYFPFWVTNLGNATTACNLDYRSDVVGGSGGSRWGPLLPGVPTENGFQFSLFLQEARTVTVTICATAFDRDVLDAGGSIEAATTDVDRSNDCVDTDLTGVDPP